jgi:hypothetical protein
LHQTTTCHLLYLHQRKKFWKTENEPESLLETFDRKSKIYGLGLKN